MNMRLAFSWLAGALALTAQQGSPSKGDAYYHFSMGHLFSEQIGATGGRNPEFVNQAIDHYRNALKADPSAGFLADELADIYLQTGRYKEAETDSQAALRDNPNDINARRVLGRIYLRLIGDPQRGRINQDYVKKATEQYTRVAEAHPKDADAFLTLGRLYKLQQDSVESEKAFKKAMDLDPGNEEAISGLAMVYSDLGDNKRAAEMLKLLSDKQPSLNNLLSLAGSYEQTSDYALAAETLKRARKLDPDNEQIQRALARDLSLADKLDEAAELYQELLKAKPKDWEAHLRLSQIYRQQNKFDKARQSLDEAKKGDPNNIEVLYHEVGLLEGEGKTEEAIGAMKQVVTATAKRNYSASEKGQRAMLLERLGILYRSEDRYADAVATFQELAALDPAQAARGQAQVADTWRQAKDYAKANEEIEQAYKKYPNDRTVRIVRANIMAETGRVDQGAADIRKMLDGKSDRETYLLIAQLYEKAKNYAEMGKAIDAAEKLSMSNEDKETIHFMRGAMLEKLKKTDQSEAEFKKILAMNPSSASALNYLGYMWADRNVKLDEALGMIKKALDQEPNNGAFLDSLGWVYFRLGKLDDAATYLRRALDRSGKDPTVNDHLGDVYAKQGKWKDAAAQWERSVKLYDQSPQGEHDSAEAAKVRKKLDGARVRVAKEQKR